MFLVNGDEIATINVRHVRPVGVLNPKDDQELQKVFAQLYEHLGKHLGKTIS